MSKKIKVIILLLAFCISFGLGFLSNYLINKHTEDKNISLNLRYGESFPMDKVYSENSIENKEYSIIFFTSAYCRACVNELTYIESMLYLFNSDTVNAYILWEDSLPDTLISQYNLDKYINAYYKDSVQLSVTYPRYYILNHDNKIVFSSDNLNQLVEKALSLNIFDVDLLQKKANQYLSEKFFPNTDGNVLFYFTMENCPDCISATPILEDDDIINKFDILYIYSHHSTDNSYFIDKYQLFRKIFDISWYPSFVVLNSETQTYTIIGETPMDQLKDLLISTNP